MQYFSENTKSGHHLRVPTILMQVSQRLEKCDQTMREIKLRFIQTCVVLMDTAYCFHGFVLKLVKCKKTKKKTSQEKHSSAFSKQVHFLKTTTCKKMSDTNKSPAKTQPPERLFKNVSWQPILSKFTRRLTKNMKDKKKKKNRGMVQSLVVQMFSI